MPEDDPFGLQSRGDRTMVVRPQPGGRRLPQPEPRRAPASSDLPDFPAFDIANTPSRHPLLAAAIPILTLAPLLRSPTPPADPDTLRSQLSGELDRYRAAMRAAGVDTE